MKKFHTWCVLLGIVLLAFLVYKIGLRELWQGLRLLGWGIVPLILAEGVGDLFRTQGWRYCLSGPLRSLPFFQLYGIRLAGSSVNYLTPTATLGGEVTRGALLYLNHQGPQAASGVIIDKLSYALTQLLLVVIGSVIVLSKLSLPLGVQVAVFTGTTVLGSGIVGFLIVQKYGKLGTVLRWLVAHKLGGETLRNATRHITKVDDELRLFYKERPLDLPFSILWHALGMSCGIIQIWYFFFLLTDDASLFLAASAWLLGTWFDLVSFALPANIGLLEGSRVMVFRLLGFQSSLGLTYGVALRLEQLFWAGIGLLVYGLIMLRAWKHDKEKELGLGKEVTGGTS